MLVIFSYIILHHIILAVNLDKGKSKGKNQNIIIRTNCCNVYFQLNLKKNSRHFGAEAKMPDGYILLFCSICFLHKIQLFFST